MKPHIICHMMSSVDGRIDCQMTAAIEPSEVYYQALDELHLDAVLEGRVSRQMHYALPEPFKTDDPAPVNCEKYFAAHASDHFEIAVDTHGTLRWPHDASDDNLLVITDEQCPKKYHDYLTANGISWIACGRKGINFKRSVEILAENFGIKRLGIVGGGHINGAFLQAGLIDEVSIMIGGGIDGRAGMTAVFDGITQKDYPPTKLQLNDVRRMGNTVWLKYSIIK
ncbi:MAG TPA: 5-amino-6-(5-phosphoribosylamino)uracil reductase [Succinivibrionaceae bacterium]|nr:5-amino-6-(5-phosphoribosylamino)uracil reductase [Succinivibrionaceae bacterium]